MTYEIGLVQVNNSFSGQNYLPYSIACLQSYVTEHSERPDKFRFLDPIYKRMPISQAVDRLKNASVVGFSTYVWNEQISLEIARRLKSINQNCLIIFGGPQVPDQPKEFLKKYYFIDSVVHNEGERTFLEILEQLPQKNFVDIKGVSFLDDNGTFFKNERQARIKDLSEVPSPFLNGMFNEIIQKNPQEKWIGLWETNRGCPFKCTFCDWGSATAAAVTNFEIDRLEKEVDWFADQKIEYVFVCDANFGIKKRDVEIAEYVADTKNRTGFPQGFSVQNTKNATERAYSTQKILSDAGLNKGVALSMQSLDPHTLSNIKRDNISLETYWELQSRFTKDKVETYSDLILGLPGETYESFVKGVNTLMENGQHNRIQFNNLSILPNAEIASKAYIEEYEIETVISEIINIHGSRETLEDDVAEYQELVISTKSMNRADWRKTRVFAWMTAFLHFDKIFQIPLITAHELSKIPYSELIEKFLNVDRKEYPLIHEINSFFHKEAQNIQEGGPEYVYSKDWLQIYWPADEYVFIKLTAEGRISEFYAEAKSIMINALSSNLDKKARDMIEASIVLNQKLLHQPFEKHDEKIEMNFNIYNFYRAVLEGAEVPEVKKKSIVSIKKSDTYYDDLSKWCREIVWWGNKKGAYLNNSANLVEELSGHF